MGSTGQSISDPVVGALFVHDFVLEAQELGENPLLPGSVQTLVGQVNQAALIYENGELGVLVNHCSTASRIARYSFS